MTVEELTTSNFEEKVFKSKKPIIIDFFADWCGPCQMLKPVFEKLSNSYNGKLNFGRINTENEEMLAMNFGIQGIPALVMVYDKKEVGRIVGYMGEDQLKAKIDSLLSKI